MRCHGGATPGATTRWRPSANSSTMSLSCGRFDSSGPVRLVLLSSSSFPRPLFLPPVPVTPPPSPCPPPPALGPTPPPLPLPVPRPPPPPVFPVASEPPPTPFARFFRGAEKPPPPGRIEGKRVS